jgi:hypothetical protein
MISVHESVTQRTSGSATFASIPKIPSHELSHGRFLREFVTLNRPVVVQNAAPRWHAMDTWTPEFFRSHFGSEIVEVTYGVKQRLSDVIDGVLSSTIETPGPYLHKVIIHQHMPQLLPDLTPENTYAFPGRYCSPLMPKRFRRPDGYLKLLIGGVGGKFPIMHFDSDNAHAVITEIYGEKEFVLFAPEDTPYVYPHENSPSTSQIDDLDHVDLSRYPTFPRAKQYRTVIGPGECIFVPSRWWHSARVITTSISVCTNMLHATNWAGFVELSSQAIARSSSFKRLSKRMYFTGIGLIMSLAESTQRRIPHTSLARLMAYFSPTSPSFRH